MPRPRRPRVVAPGIIRDEWGFRVYVSVGGQRVEERRLPDTPIAEMQAWRDEQRTELRRSNPSAGSHPGTFGSDVRRYLGMITAMPSAKDRKREIEAWLPLFTGRARRSIQHWEIQQQLDTWLAGGASRSTVRHRRTALAQLWRKLDGPAKPNPAKAVTAPTDAKPQPRGLDWALAHEIIAAVVDYTSPKKGQKGRVPGSLARLRLRVILETGLPHSLLTRIRAADFDREARTLRIAGRNKGQGTDPSVLPLTVDGAKALEALVAARANRPFSRSSLHKAFRSACKAVELSRLAAGTPVDLSGVRPYDLRHTFGSHVFSVSGGNLSTVAGLLLHAPGSLTTAARYAMAAVPAHLAAAVARLDEEQRGTVDGTTEANTNQDKQLG